eukprot:gene514-8038_t
MSPTASLGPDTMFITPLSDASPAFAGDACLVTVVLTALLVAALGGAGCILCAAGRGRRRQRRPRPPPPTTAGDGDQAAEAAAGRGPARRGRSRRRRRRGLPHLILLRLVEEMGISPRILALLRSLYARLQRRFRAAGSVGAAFTATNGIVQGCALSVILLNAIVAVWARAVEAEVLDPTPEAYADDQYATAATPEPVAKVWRLTGTFGALTGGRLNTTKCQSFGTRAQAPLRGADGGAVPDAAGLKSLGVPLSCRQRRRAGVLEARMRAARAAAARVARVPLPLEARAVLCTARVLSRGMYGCTVHEVAPSNILLLRRAVTRAIWGQHHRRRCPEMVMTLLARGHLVDPR